MSHVSLDISGMTCAACSSRVAKALSRVDGVSDAQVNLALERANIELTDAVTLDALIAAVEKAGYGATLRESDQTRQRLADAEREAVRLAEERTTLLRFGISALLTLPLVIGTLPMMIGTGHALIGPWTQAALAAGVMLASGTRFYREAFNAVRRGSANMAVLVSLGTTVAFVASLIEVLRGNGHAHLYFEAAAVVLTLVMLGKYLEARAKRGAGAALSALGRLQPAEAELVVAEGTRKIPAAALSKGDLVLVRPGARFPADGIIRSGHSSVDEALVTGESLPVERGEGDTVLTGTINGEAALEVVVSRVGEDTRLARMARLVEEAQTGEAPIQRLVDRISAIFVPVILVVAAVTFLVWWLALGDTISGLSATIAVLVIACPCALGLATPTALVAGTGAAARAGILIRDIETLERAGEIAVVAFDKTGTLTKGKPTIAAMTATDGGVRSMLTLAAAIEAKSEHPLGKALVAHAMQESVAVGDAKNVRAIYGQGLSGTVDGRTVAVGNEKLALSLDVDASQTAEMTGKIGAGGTIAFVIVDRKLAGALRFADEPRPEAAATLAELKSRGLRTVMLTGDNEAAANTVERAIGIDEVRAGLQPEEKVEALKALAATHGDAIAFVGDGVNDGPALVTARLGIALSSGADVAREAAPITLMRPDLRLVPAALDIAARTRLTIRQNLGWAFVYNLFGIPLAAFGMLSPTFAGAAMAFSSVSVVANALRLARWKVRSQA
ncbi:heavy metal translocating P-type ATPase [Mesorhizobium sp. VNQ89]|uniref:heavy metal translocating P-type ATPase n=1 Tax=Mesorhizobium quangtriensis TaxID=3157709 RepID=UPI0032B78359